jgi:predicted transglutaminase-like cysteine proteinase
VYESGADLGNSGNNSGILRQFKALLGRNRLGELLVLKGVISSQDLRFALKQQKSTQLPLGRIFLKHAMISRRQLFFILARQWALRGVAASMFYFASVAGFGVKKARAETIKDVPAIIAVSAGTVSYNKLTSYPGLFGAAEKRSGNLKPFTKWTSMFSRFERDLKRPGSEKIITAWQENLRDFQGLPLKEMARRVNDLANSKPYISDNRNWGMSDYWETPIEFLQKGGDCEDFAIAKYTALRALGVPEDRLRIVILHDNVKNIPHAILAVYTDDGIYALDNQIKTLVDANREGRYRPIFSINREGWWLHSAPDATMVASAQ